MKASELRERVLKGLDVCVNDIECHGCPYSQNTRCHDFCNDDLMSDAYKLLAYDFEFNGTED